MAHLLALVTRSRALRTKIAQSSRLKRNASRLRTPSLLADLLVINVLNLAIPTMSVLSSTNFLSLP